MATRDFEVLLIEDDADHVYLLREALKDGKERVSLSVVNDGVSAMSYLQREPPHGGRPRPDLILLDLAIPKKDGHEVLEEIKGNQRLRGITVVVLTGSESERDILKAYGLGANCYVFKPTGFKEFAKVVRSIVRFWAR